MSDREPPPDGRSPVERLRWFLRTDDPTVAFVREAAFGVLAVLAVGLLLFGTSGVWPPMVAVESPSMEPHVYPGDLVFVVEPHRFSPDFATPGTGVVTYEAAAERETYRKFGTHGDVIVFAPGGGGGTPVIHRARFWVEEGEDWYDRADPRYLRGGSCEAVPSCPAPHAGFVTKGDGNAEYDQAGGSYEPVRPSWVRGKAVVRVPWLGYVRLAVE